MNYIPWWKSLICFQDIEAKYDGNIVRKKTVPLLVITEDINDQEIADNYRTVEPGRLGEDLNDSD